MREQQQDLNTANPEQLRDVAEGDIVLDRIINPPTLGTVPMDLRRILFWKLIATFWTNPSK